MVVNGLQLKGIFFFFFRYHVPRSWLKPTQNLLVAFEELGGDASKIALVSRTVTSVCANAYENHPKINIANYTISSLGKSENKEAMVNLQCAQGQSISAIKFASFGTPSGTCGSFQRGTCHAPNSHSIVEKAFSILQSYSIAVIFLLDFCMPKLKLNFVSFLLFCCHRNALGVRVAWLPYQTQVLRKIHVPTFLSSCRWKLCVQEQQVPPPNLIQDEVRYCLKDLSKNLLMSIFLHGYWPLKL